MAISANLPEDEPEPSIESLEKKALKQIVAARKAFEEERKYVVPTPPPILDSLTRRSDAVDKAMDPVYKALDRAVAKNLLTKEEYEVLHNEFFLKAMKTLRSENPEQKSRREW